ncbi:MAG: TlpA family protein disulfide reductase [Gammaproteobacteria bacterium]
MIRTVLVLVLLAAAAAGGFYLYRLAFVPEDALVGTSSPAAGTQRPEFSLPDMSGKLRSISEWDGDALVVNFWATWCAPCRREIPLLMALQEAHAGDPLQVIGIAIDQPDEVRRFAGEMGMNYPVLVGEQAAVEAASGFGVDFIGLPFTAFVGPEGRVHRIHLGELEAGELDALVAEILPE